MPYKNISGIKIAGTEKDRRIKLDDADRNLIRELHKDGFSLRRLARAFGVNKKTIGFIVYPEKYEEQKAKMKEIKAWKIYYNKEKHTDSIRNHRRYKQEIYLQTKGEQDEN